MSFVMLVSGLVVLFYLLISLPLPISGSMAVLAPPEGGLPEPSMLGRKQWGTVISAAAKGKTTGTFDSIGTWTIKKGAKTVLGIQYAVAPSVLTSGENGIPIARIDSDDLAFPSRDFVLDSCIMGDGIATNDKEVPIQRGFIFLNLNKGGKTLSNSKVNLSLSGDVTTTGGWTIKASLVFINFSLNFSDPDVLSYIEEWRSSSLTWFDGQDFANGTSGATADTTISTNEINIPSSANRLVGLQVILNPNAPTTVEEAVGSGSFSANNLDDFTPQEYVANAWGASLGTPVGQQNILNQPAIPTRFPFPNENFTVVSKVSLAIALSNAADWVTYAAYKEGKAIN